jgi:hypothetical protein
LLFLFPSIRYSLRHNAPATHSLTIIFLMQSLLPSILDCIFTIDLVGLLEYVSRCQQRKFQEWQPYSLSRRQRVRRGKQVLDSNQDLSNIDTRLPVFACIHQRQTNYTTTHNGRMRARKPTGQNKPTLDKRWDERNQEQSCIPEAVRNV